jgi:FKBP-type peptidyl-prolyl cis-trans isomerase FkpA
MRNSSFIKTVLISLACSVSCALGSGCRSDGVGTASLNDPEPAATAEEAHIMQASYRTEGPDGKEAESSFHVTASGLKYRILRRGNGERPTEYDRVQVSYRGWLDDGKVFDSSYERGKPTTFKLRDVVPGWTEGMQHVSEGGKIELEIPSSLGYGPRGQPPMIPPHATLHFIVELHEVY